MNSLLAAFPGFGSTELLLILLSFVFLGVVIGSVVDIISNRNLNDLAKIIWIIIIVCAPVLGTLVYLYYSRNRPYSVK
ncbi:PLDc N-terminal domain-containing protein [Larkinella punicea]|uniref:Cardiolipin synthase N-terminal domain-containing protein n=1 Tax=Larkinella punicea TaxID=2315727 RepID=A0A368JQI0_9BACT|nr:hypothetical protein DUE52_08815 [Larkinella punicea]